jgi:FkbM family methyltransferase
MPALVYDIGLHDGRDSSHYLREGCRVVAIDANPTMCEAAEAQFRNYIQTGQLKIVNRGVAERKAQLEFWVCDDMTTWSSFSREMASREGVKNHSIFVDCVPIMEIIDEFGVPDYMKIDIEGNDRICIAGLTEAVAPQYISIEMDHHHADQDLHILARLGYRGFKIICQNNSWHQVTERNIGFYERPPDHHIISRLRRLRAAPSRLLAGRRLGESGPWGEKTWGRWHSFDHAHSVWRSLRELDQRQRNARAAAGDTRPNNRNGLSWWFDIHARK